jgi:hypothetical protein
MNAERLIGETLLLRLLELYDGWPMANRHLLWRGRLASLVYDEG